MLFKKPTGLTGVTTPILTLLNFTNKNKMKKLENSGFSKGEFSDISTRALKPSVSSRRFSHGSSFPVNSVSHKNCSEKFDFSCFKC